MATYGNDPIPFSVTTDILSRLPLKTLVRFRLACKLWESTICDRGFRCTSSVSRFLFSVCNWVDRTISFLASPPTQDLQLAQSFNLEALGKLELTDDYCFSSFQARHVPWDSGIDPALLPIQYPLVESVHGLMIVENENNVMIYNPTTRETKTLPSGHIPVASRLFREIRNRYCRTVLHYDSVSGEYICVRFHRNPDGYVDGRIIGLEDDQWRTLPRPGKRKRIFWCRFILNSSAYLDGALYVVALFNELARIYTSTMAFEEVNPPSRMSEKIKLCLLFIYQGKLAMTSRLMEHAYDRCMFTLDDLLGKKWTRIDFAAVVDADIRRKMRQCEKRAINDDGEIVLVNQYLQMRNEIYYFNPATGNVRVVAAEVSGLTEDEFENHFGDRRPRVLLHTDHVDHLMLLK